MEILKKLHKEEMNTKATVSCNLLLQIKNVLDTTTITFVSSLWSMFMMEMGYGEKERALLFIWAYFKYGSLFSDVEGILFNVSSRININTHTHACYHRVKSGMINIK